MKQADILGLLPAVFQKAAEPGSPLAALLDVMERLHAPAENALEGLDATLDPRRTSEPFVHFLARWVDLDRFFEVARGRAPSSRLLISTGPGHLRELIASAAYLSKWRGTRKGLILFLEIATGLRGFEIDEELRPFHIRVRAPAEAAPHRAMIERIIALEKPVYVTTEPVIFE